MNRYGWLGIGALALGMVCVGWTGERPYEMVWANRTEDDHPPLLALTDPSGWQVETKNAEATFTRSDDVLLFGESVCKLAYRGTGPDPTITLRPPQPVVITQAFDAGSSSMGSSSSVRPMKPARYPPYLPPLIRTVPVLKELTTADAPS